MAKHVKMSAGLLTEEETINNVVEDLTPQLGGDLDAQNQDITALKALTFQGGESVTWNTADFCIDVPTGTGSTVQVGQELMNQFHNGTGVQIDNGSVVYIDVAVTGGRSEIMLADASDHTKVHHIHVATHDIADGTAGFCTHVGHVRDLDTSSFSAGDHVYLSDTTPGALTNVRPSFPSHALEVGIVLSSHATTGSIAVEVSGTETDIYNNFWNGTFLESFDFLITSNGTVVTGTLTNTAGGDNLTMNFSDGFTNLDVNPGLTLSLTPGLDTAPQTVYVYILQSDKILTESTSDWPTVEHIKIAKVIIASAASVQTDDLFTNQNINDHIQQDSGLGHLSHIVERVRTLPAGWKSGCEGTATIVGASTPDDVYVAATAGKVYQLHVQDFDAIDLALGDKAYVANHPVTTNLEVTNLNVLLVDSNNVTLNNTSFSFVMWGINNKTGEPSHLLLNLPTGSYAHGTPSLAVSDAFNYSVYSMPEDFKSVGFLIARFTFTYKNDVWVLHDTEDLRGFIPNSTAGGGGAGGTGITTWLALTDTPVSYSGEAGNVPKVSAGETALEFISTIHNVVEDTTPQLGGSLDVNGQSIVSISAGDIAITPDTTGDVILDGLKWPQVDGTANYVLETDGAGQLSWVIQSGGGGGLADVVDDLTPQLGGDLDVNGQSIVSVSAGDIDITADTTGVINTTQLSVTSGSYPPGRVTRELASTTSAVGVFDIMHRRTGGSPPSNGSGSALTFTVADNSTNTQVGNIFYQVDTTLGSSNMAIQVFKSTVAQDALTIDKDSNSTFYGDMTLGGDIICNSFTIKTLGGQDITLAPDTTGDVVLDGLKWPQADGTADYVLKTDGAGQLGWVLNSGGGLADVVDDTTPQLGGDLDVNGNDIVSVSAGDINILADTTGMVNTTQFEATSGSYPVVRATRELSASAAAVGTFDVRHRRTDGSAPSNNYGVAQTFTVADNSTNTQVGNVSFQVDTTLGDSKLALQVFNTSVATDALTIDKDLAAILYGDLDIQGGGFTNSLGTISATQMEVTGGSYPPFRVTRELSATAGAAASFDLRHQRTDGSAPSNNYGVAQTYSVADNSTTTQLGNVIFQVDTTLGDSKMAIQVFNTSAAQDALTFDKDSNGVLFGALELGGALDVSGNSIVSLSAGDIAITPDTTGEIVLDGLKWPQADGTADYVLKTDGAGQLSWVVQSSGGGSWANKTGAYTAVDGDLLLVNATSAYTITLPASPSAGEVVRIKITGDVVTNNITVGRNSQPIDSATDDFIIDVLHVDMTFVYYDGTIGWVY